MSREEGEGPEYFWKMLDYVAAITNCKISKEVHLGVREKFKVDDYQPSILHNMTQIPLIIPLLLSDKQFECYLTHNYFLAIKKELMPFALLGEKKPLIVQADECARKYFSADFLFGTLMKAAVIENEWLNFSNSKEGLKIMENQSEVAVSVFKKIYFPTRRQSFTAIIQGYDRIESQKKPTISLQDRLNKQNVSLNYCVDTSLNAPESTTFSLVDEELKTIVTNVILTQAKIDLLRKLTG
jgi:hypothetical protein